MTIRSKTYLLTAVLAGGLLCSCAQYIQDRRKSGRRADERLAAERGVLKLHESALRSSGIFIPQHEKDDLDYRLSRDRAVEDMPAWNLERSRQGAPLEPYMFGPLQ
jgi:hypothetical protein